MRIFVGTIGITPFNGQEEYLIRQAIGRIREGDNGKQVWHVAPGVYQVENESQRKARVEQNERDARRDVIVENIGNMSDDEFRDYMRTVPKMGQADSLPEEAPERLRYKHQRRGKQRFGF